MICISPNLETQTLPLEENNVVPHDLKTITEEQKYCQKLYSNMLESIKFVTFL